MKPLITAATSTPSREEELVAAAQEGNPYAFEALFRRYREPITGYVRARVRDDGRTEDIVQEIFFSAHNSLPTLGRPRAFRSWLYQIAQNACLDEARRRNRTDALILGWDEFPPPDERIVTHNPSPEHQLSQKQELADVTHAIDELPTAQHDALVMRELEGRSYEEIGRRMSLTPAAVESVLFRARRGVKRAATRVAGFLPLPAFLGRRGSGAQSSSAGSFGAQAQGAAAQLSVVGGDHAVTLAQKAAAVVAAVAVLGGGTVAVQQSGVLESSASKKEQGKPPATAGSGDRGGSGTTRDNLAPPGRGDQAKFALTGDGSSPAAAAPISNTPTSVVGDPGAPTASDPAAPTTTPDTSSPAGSGTAPSSGSNAPQSNQPASTPGAESPTKNVPTKKQPADPQPPLTTPSGEPIPPELPPGIQRQLESGKRTLDELPPGQQKKLGN